MPLPETLCGFANDEQCASVFAEMTLSQTCIKEEIGNPGRNGSIIHKRIVLDVSYKYKLKFDNLKRQPRLLRSLTVGAKKE